MLTFDSLLDAVGQKPGVIFAAFAGGLARVTLFGIKGVSVAAIASAVGSVIGGTLAAIFLGPIAPYYLNWPPNGPATLAFTFIIGVFGMEVMKLIGDRLPNWITTSKGPKDA